MKPERWCHTQTDQILVGFMGKAYGKVDAQYFAVEIGDLVTMSLNPVHTMEATDPVSTFGAATGKVLRPPKEDKVPSPILAAPQ